MMVFRIISLMKEVTEIKVKSLHNFAKDKQLS